MCGNLSCCVAFADCLFGTPNRMIPRRASPQISGTSSCSRHSSRSFPLKLSMKGVLHRLSRLDVMQFDALLHSPGEKVPTRQLTAVV